VLKPADLQGRCSYFPGKFAMPALNLVSGAPAW